MKDRVLELMNETPVNLVKLHDMINKMNTVDVADVFEELSKEKAAPAFRLLSKDIAADVFSYISPDKQQIIVEALTDTEVGNIINELFVDDAVDFIEEMPANVVRRVLQNVNDDRRQIINQLLRYPEDSAGSIMTTEYVALKEDTTVREAFDVIRTTGVDKETIYTCFVIRRDRLLVGVVSAKALMLSKQHSRIGDIMDTKLLFAHTTDDQEAIASQFRKYSLLSMPVVDTEQRLVGIVTVDDIVQVMEEEATEDFEKMAAITPSEDPYMKTSALKHSKNRIPWLMFLMLSATITGGIISSFENALAAVPALVTFIPMLMDTGGNAGSQSSTLIIRGLALGEIEFRDILSVIWREVRVGILCGLALGVVNFVRIFLMNDGDYVLCIVVTLSLIATVLISKTVGCILPLLAKKVKMDPAIMAAPLVTTIVDATSLIVFFSIARSIFGL